MSIIVKQLQKVQKHFDALKEYKEFIDKIGFEFSVEEFNNLDTPLKAVLEAAGCKLENVIKTTIFLDDINNFTAVNEITVNTLNTNLQEARLQLKNCLKVRK